MTRMLLSLSALIASIVLLVSGNTLLMTLLGVRLSLEQVAAGIIGWVLVCYSVGFVLGSLYCTRIIERVGHIRSFAVFCALMAMVSTVHALHVHPVTWALLRIVAGVSMAGLLLVVESWFSTRASNENRGTLFAIYQVVFYLASAGGQLLVGVAEPSTYIPFSLGTLLLSFALVPLALTKMEAPSIEQAERFSFRNLFRISPLGLIAATVSGIVISAFNNIGPVYGNLIQLDVNAIAIFMAVTVFSAMVFAWPLGRLSDLFDRRWVMLVLSLFAAASSLITALLGHLNLLALFVSAELFVGFGAALYPIAVAITNDRLHSSQIVAASSSLLLCYGIGSCIGPILGSYSITLMGPQGLFAGTGASLFALTLYTFWYIQNSRRIPVEAQETFVASLPVSTPIITELDPRNEEFVESETIQEEKAAQEETTNPEDTGESVSGSSPPPNPVQDTADTNPRRPMEGN